MCSSDLYLNAHWRKHIGGDYEKGDPRLYIKLTGRVSAAIDNAQWVLETFHDNAPCRTSNASTEVYQLVRQLLQP